jgi:predicted nucleotidyltransferase
LLPETFTLCQRANFVVHPSVTQVFLTGSRGLAGGWRADSDIDMSLLVDRVDLPRQDAERAQYLRSVLETTLRHWQGFVEADLAAVFDTTDCCGLRCFQNRDYDPEVIRGRGIDCFGVYKIQRGFDGYVKQGVNIARMYPILCIWRR